MNLKHAGTKICLAACLGLWLAHHPAAGQNKKGETGGALAHFEKAIEQGKGGDIERALLDYAIANPNSAAALELLARVRARQGRLQEAKGLYQRVLALDPSSIPAKINVGRLTYALGEKEEARRILSSIEGISAAPPLTRLELATGLFLVGEIQKALTIAEKLPLGVRNKEALPLVAAIYLETGGGGNKSKLGGLIPLMNRAAAASPVLAVQSAEVLQNAGMNREAAALLRRALSASPKNVGILVLLGRLEVNAREFAQARRRLNLAAALEPNSAAVISSQALLENATGNLTGALELLNKARRIAPGSATVLADFVLLAMRAGKSQAALDAARELIAVDPDNPEYLYLLGAASLQRGNLGVAQESLERFVRLRPKDSRGCLALGLTLAAQPPQFENAQKRLLHCLEIDPANYEAAYQLGLSYRAQGETAKAIELLEAASRRAPDYPLVLRDLGTLYLQTGAEAKARRALERAVALSPQDAETHFQLSRLYNRIGQGALAKQHLETFQKLRDQGDKSAQ